jgi:hypothetical protein
VNSFDPFLSRLGTIHDPRRAEGKLYQLPYILLFSILAIVTGANSYRDIRTFIKVQLKRLNRDRSSRPAPPPRRGDLTPRSQDAPHAIQIVRAPRGRQPSGAPERGRRVTSAATIAEQLFVKGYVKGERSPAFSP